MTKLNRALGLMVLLVLAVMLGRAPAAAAGEGVTFKVTVKSAFLRREPRPGSTRVLSVFRDQVFPVTGRNSDNSWLELNKAGWISSALGEMRGDLSTVPVVAAAAPAPTAAPESAPATGGAPDAPGVSLKLTITAKSAYVRTAPTWSAARSGSVFKGQTFTAIGRSMDAQWVQIQHGNRLGWVAASAGRLSGDLGALTVTDFIPPGQTNAAWASGSSSDGSRPLWIPVITPYMRAVYEASPQAGHSLNLFAAVGDCNSESQVYLQRLREKRFSFKGHEALRATADFFWQSFQRDSLATYGGFNSGSILNPDWGHPTYCQRSEGPFACELRLSNASVAFIQLGTGDQYIWHDSEKNYRAMIEYALQHGVLPVLVTKADAVESQQGGAEPDYLNGVMRRLAQEYQIPLLDFWLATRSLPGYGLQADGFHLNSDGINLHILATLQTLEAIWRR